MTAHNSTHLIRIYFTGKLNIKVISDLHGNTTRVENILQILFFFNAPTFILTFGFNWVCERVCHLREVIWNGLTLVFATSCIFLRSSHIRPMNWQWPKVRLYRFFAFDRQLEMIFFNNCNYDERGFKRHLRANPCKPSNWRLLYNNKSLFALQRQNWFSIQSVFRSCVQNSGLHSAFYYYSWKKYRLILKSFSNFVFRGRISNWHLIQSIILWNACLWIQTDYDFVHFLMKHIFLLKKLCQIHLLECKVEATMPRVDAERQFASRKIPKIEGISMHLSNVQLII